MGALSHGISQQQVQKVASWKTIGNGILDQK